MYTLFDEIVDGQIDFLAGLSVSEIVHFKDGAVQLILLEIIDECY